MRVVRWLLLIVFVPVVLVAGFLALDVKGTPETAGDIVGGELPPELVEGRAQRQTQAATELAGEPAAKQILFGDLHVHSTFSMDAFLWALPTMNGKGLHPPADACDYARYCSDLDFWSLTDHAESLTPRHWEMTKETVRQCNALTDPDNPDLVTYLGWEWTQVGQSPDDHWGHRNVVLRDTADEDVPLRPITSGGLPLRHMRQRIMSPMEELIAPYLTNFEGRQLMKSQFVKQAELRGVPYCDDSQHVRDLPADCTESAETPEALWRKLDQWGVAALAIPHGTSWGFYTPPGVKWDKQLSRAQHDPKYQALIEVFSGHGNSEEYRDWRAVEYDAGGAMHCPEPTADYLPCCHRAGELIRERCEQPDSAACEARVAKARADYLDAGVAGHVVIPGVAAEDWLNCGQCTDCFLPAQNYRPGNSVQYIMALSNFDEAGPAGDPQRFRFGFIASSDDHSSQPGTGYKEVGRHQNTDTFGPTDPLTRSAFTDVAKHPKPGPESIPFDRRGTHLNLFQYAETERLGSFFYTGGLVAVHSEGRRRGQIFEAMQSREVYGTSGERILLWFDLINAGETRRPMGSEVTLADNPRFRVRAVGAFEQRPGCPEHSVTALGDERLDYICGGECYNPGDTRQPIERIEVVRIRPQSYPDEPVAELIDDPWRVFACSGDPAGCSVEFADPDFLAGQREALYYVRALQAPTPTINAGQLRCEPAPGPEECEGVDICYGDPRTPRDDDCLAPAAARAWSSPIYVQPVAGT